MRTEEEERRTAECSNRKGRKVVEGWLSRAKPRRGGACSSVGVTRLPWGRPAEPWGRSADREGTLVVLKMTVSSLLAGRARNVSAAMSRRFAISNSGEAVEELTSNHLPNNSMGKGQGFIQQKGTLMSVSRAFRVPLLTG